MPKSQSIRRLLLALAGLTAMLGAQTAVAQAEYGEIGNPAVLTGKVSESGQKSHAFGVDPTDDSFFVADEVVQGETTTYRIQKFSASGEPLGEIQLKAHVNSVQLGNAALEGIAVDPSAKRAYLLVDREREEEEEEPLFDPSTPAAASLYAFSTEPESGKLKAATGTKNEEGLLSELHSESKEPRGAFLDPHGITVDPGTGEIVILGQVDMSESPTEPELRTAVERVHSTGVIASRYVDIENCLDGANTLSEPNCEAEGESFSPIVVPAQAAEGKVYAERSHEIWELPASANEFKPTVKSKVEPKTFETHPRRVAPTETHEEFGSEQTLLEFPKANEVLAEELGGTMAFAPGAAEGEGKLYLTGAITTKVEKGTAQNAGVLVLGYGGAGEVKELGWTGGQSESSGEKCSIPKKGNQALLIAPGSNEGVFLFDAHEKLGGSGTAGVDIFQFGLGGAGCPHATATEPPVMVKNNHGEEVEVSPVPLGEPTTLSSTVSGANAVKVQWKFKDVTTGEEEPAEEGGYEFALTSLKHTFEHAGEYEITEIVETDDLASPTVEIKRKVKVSATPIALEFSYPASATVGSPVRFEATAHDPHESGTLHLKYAWKFGDGSEKSGEASASAFNEEHTYTAEGARSVTLKVTDSHGVSAEVTHEISVAGVSKEPEHKVVEEHKTTPPPPPPPPAEGAPEVTPTSTSLSVNQTGAVALQIKCPAGDSSCSGTVTLRTLGAVAARAAKHGKGKHKVVLTLASGSFTVAGGKVQTVTLRLSSKARALLAHSHSLRAQLTIVAHNASGASHTTQTTVVLHVVVKGKHRGKH